MIRQRIRGGLTYANVMSTIAAFGVLAGGGAWAATKIGTNDIENGAVTAKKIAKKAVTSAKVKNGSLLEKDFDDGQIRPRAYATYDPETNALVPSKTKNLTLDSSTGGGAYCFELAPGIALSKTSPVVGSDRPLNADVYGNLAFPTLIETGQFVCPDAELAVQTFRFSGGVFSPDDELAFTIVVP